MLQRLTSFGACAFAASNTANVEDPVRFSPRYDGTYSIVKARRFVEVRGVTATTLRNEKIIAAVQCWQTNPDVHPLTCGNDSSHRLLEAMKQGRRVVLTCPDCDYIQTVIPQIVIEAGPTITPGNDVDLRRRSK